ncbi:MAG: hypothetical protein IJN32_02520, partial [Thermoguttaceae bacterium]|nr:hypothetical protein [Thermoguttaceae bacterium]
RNAARRNAPELTFCRTVDVCSPLPLETPLDGTLFAATRKNDRSPESSPVADAPPHGRFNTSTRRFSERRLASTFENRPSRSINRRGA